MFSKQSLLLAVLLPALTYIVLIGGENLQWIHPENLQFMLGEGTPKLCNDSGNPYSASIKNTVIRISDKIDPNMPVVGASVLIQRLGAGGVFENIDGGGVVQTNESGNALFNKNVLANLSAEKTYRVVATNAAETDEVRLVFNVCGSVFDIETRLRQ